MKGSFVLRYLSCVALACTVIAGAPTAASAQSTDLHYATSITGVYGSPYPLTGHLEIQIFPDGTLRGYYHTSYYKLFIPVAGGRDGTYIWFDIGPSSMDLGLGAGPQGKLHVVATMNGDGSFRGQVYPQQAAVLSGLSRQYNFDTQPLGYQPDQFIFSGTPSAAEPTPKP